MGVKSCENCRNRDTDYVLCQYCENYKTHPAWSRIECPNCGGALSELRFHRGKAYRHCYSCHFEFYDKEETK